MARTRVHLESPDSLGHRVRHQIPETPMQALMQAPPYAEPDESSLEKEPRFEALRQLLEGAGGVLDEREMWVVHAKFWRGLSFKQIANELSFSKTHVFRVWDSAKRKLAVALAGDGNDWEVDE